MNTDEKRRKRDMHTSCEMKGEHTAEEVEACDGEYATHPDPELAAITISDNVKL